MSNLPRAATRGRFRDRARAILAPLRWLVGLARGSADRIARVLLRIAVVAALVGFALAYKAHLDEAAIHRARVEDSSYEVEVRVRRIEAAVAEWRHAATEWRAAFDLYRLERAAERRVELEDVLCVLRPLGLRWRSDLPVPSAWRPLAEGVPIPTAADCDLRYGAPAGRAPR